MRLLYNSTVEPKNYTDLTTHSVWNAHISHHVSVGQSAVIKMWRKTIIFMFATLVVALLYSTIQLGSFTLTSISTAIAATAALMIGSSFALSGMCYYFNFLDKKIMYRKYLGLVGYFLALLYSFSLLFINPDKYFFGFFNNILSPDIILGLIAMSILTFMAVISNNWAIKKIGPQKWRDGLRLGYVAYILLVIRAVILEGSVWIDWFMDINNLPPVRLVISCFAVCVITLRISILFKEHFKKHVII